MFVRSEKNFLSVYVDDIKMLGKKQHVSFIHESLSSIDLVHLTCIQRECNSNEDHY